jgi:hypothetical protein
VVNPIKKKLDDKQWEVQGDQKENKSEQALQIIGHVVAEFYANKRRQFVVSNVAL